MKQLCWEFIKRPSVLFYSSTVFTSFKQTFGAERTKTITIPSTASHNKISDFKRVELLSFPAPECIEWNGKYGNSGRAKMKNKNRDVVKEKQDELVLLWHHMKEKWKFLNHHYSNFFGLENWVYHKF